MDMEKAPSIEEGECEDDSDEIIDEAPNMCQQSSRSSSRSDNNASDQRTLTKHRDEPDKRKNKRYLSTEDESKVLQFVKKYCHSTSLSSEERKSMNRPETSSSDDSTDSRSKTKQPSTAHSPSPSRSGADSTSDDPLSKLLAWSRARNEEMKIICHSVETRESKAIAQIIIGSRSFSPVSGRCKSTAKLAAAQRALDAIERDNQKKKSPQSVSSQVPMKVESPPPPSQKEESLFHESKLHVISENTAIADHLAGLTHQQFSTIQQFLESKQHVHIDQHSRLAAILMHDGSTSIDTVISLATGNQCVVNKHAATSMNEVILDSHAEVMARRGFLRFLYRQLAMHLLREKNKLAMAESSMNDEEPISILEVSQDRPRRYRVNGNITFHMYISGPPCGDAEQYSLRSLNRHTPLIVVPSQHKPIYAVPGHGLLQCKVPDRVTGSIYTKPVDSEEPLLTFEAFQRGGSFHSMSCSDKLMRWNIAGLQGCLLSHFVEPIYLDSLTLGSGFESRTLARALCCRLERMARSKDNSGKMLVPLAPGYRINHPSLASVGVAIQRKLNLNSCTGNTINAHSSLSINWYYDSLELQSVEVHNGATGLVMVGPNEEAKCSRLSRMELFKLFLHIARLSGREELYNISSYSVAKGKARDYRHVLAVLRHVYRRSKVGRWLSKPVEFQKFLPH